MKVKTKIIIEASIVLIFVFPVYMGWYDRSLLRFVLLLVVLSVKIEEEKQVQSI